MELLLSGKLRSTLCPDCDGSLRFSVRFGAIRSRPRPLPPDWNKSHICVHSKSRRLCTIWAKRAFLRVWSRA